MNRGNNNWRTEPYNGSGGYNSSNNWRQESNFGNGGGSDGSSGSGNSNTWRSEPNTSGQNNGGGSGGGFGFRGNNSGPNNRNGYVGPTSSNSGGSSNTSNNNVERAAGGATGGAAGGPTTGGLRSSEMGARIRDGGGWPQHPENYSSGETDRQASQQAGWQAVECRNPGPPLLLPRPPIQRGPDQEDQDSRPRLAATPTRGREATTGTWRRRRSSSQGTGDTKDTIYKYTKCVF